MKKALFTLFFTLVVLSASAQKKPLDHSVYDGWQSIGETTLSPSGNVLVFTVQPQEGDGRLTVRRFGKKPLEVVIERGYHASILDDENFVVGQIRPLFRQTRRARIAKKKELPRDSVFVLDLRSGQVRKFAHTKGLELGSHGTAAIAFETSDTSFVAPRLRKEKDRGHVLAVYHLASGAIDTLIHIDGCEFSEDGLHLSLVQKTDAKHSVVGFYDVATRSTRFLTDTTTWHDAPSFNLAGTQAVYLQADDTLSSGSKHAELFRYDLAAGRAEKLVSLEAQRSLPAGWGLTERSRRFFTDDDSHIFAGILEIQPPKDTALVSFETPGLDIWNWDAPKLPPFMKAERKNRSEGGNCLCVYQDGRLVPFTLNPDARFRRDDDDRRILIEEVVDPVATQWDLTTPSRLSWADVEGHTTFITEASLSDVWISPEGKFALWWDLKASAWMLHDLSAGTTRNLTEGCREAFWDEEDDHPAPKQPYGCAGWTLGDREVLLYDRYDLWAVDTGNGAFRRLTRGREEDRRYRLIDTRDPDGPSGYGENLLLSVFDCRTKENGLAPALLHGKKAPATVAFGGWTYTAVHKALNAPVYTFRRGNFQEPMNLRYTDFGKTDLQVSDINQQQKDFNWGTVELYKWNAYDGTPLEGLLYRPEDFDPSRKYPVMVYFYERNSENLYSYHSPSPSRSTINIPFYVSRGYVVFVPDIVYSSGIPGESAYNCIVSGAESLTRFPWIDKEHMAIQGQSWGGYQVAYLITRTSLFCAAGAGAPVANMTSAYGGIRWESGMSRQFQYEQTQSRIGRDLWHGVELYMENSPLFKLPQVKTPVLIMHNDDDGAVPWYQGIELFMGLRRLGKPAWLLEYNGEAHNLRQRRNTKDLSIRLQQFFDHYLKGAPAPAWMRTGVPTHKKGYYFGYETE